MDIERRCSWWIPWESSAAPTLVISSETTYPIVSQKVYVRFSWTISISDGSSFSAPRTPPTSSSRDVLLNFKLPGTRYPSLLRSTLSGLMLTPVSIHLRSKRTTKNWLLDVSLCPFFCFRMNDVWPFVIKSFYAAHDQCLRLPVDGFNPQPMIVLTKKNVNRQEKRKCLSNLWKVCARSIQRLLILFPRE